MSIEKGMKVALRGEYRVVLNAGTERESDLGWMPNLITDYGMDSLASDVPSPRTGYCSLGTGAAAPANTDTALQAFLAAQQVSSGTVSSIDSTPPYQQHYTNQYIFAQGAVVGNVTELGAGPNGAGTNLFSRCLIVDGTGAPTALTVTAIDQLTVYYRLNIAYDLTDHTGSVSLAGTTYSYTARAANATVIGGKYLLMQTVFGIPSLTAAFNAAFLIAYGSTATLGAVTSTPSGTQATPSATAQSVAAYTPGSFYRDVTVTLGATIGNPPGGIGAVEFLTGSTFNWQYQFTPVIPKDNTKTLSLTFRVSWARA